MKVELEIGPNLKRVLKRMIDRAPEEVGNIISRWTDVFNNFLSNETIKDLEIEIQTNLSDTSTDIAIRKIPKK